MLIIIVNILIIRNNCKNNIYCHKNMTTELELSLKQICCTCLSTDRNLSQLSKINDGVNYLYHILSSDAEAYSNGFLQDIVSLHVCWECESLIKKQIRFKKQACFAQRRLSLVSEGYIRTHKIEKSLSKLTRVHQNSYTYVFNSNKSLNNLIVFSPDICLKGENAVHTNFDSENRLDDHSSIDVEESLEDTIMSCKNENISNTSCTENDKDSKCTKINSTVHTNNEIKESDLENESLINQNLNTDHGGTNSEEKKEYFKEVTESEHAIELLREKKKIGMKYTKSFNRCDICIQVFKTSKVLENHYYKLHTNKPDFEKCGKCLQYVRKTYVKKHQAEHTKYYKCNMCEEVMFNKHVLPTHFYMEHSIKIKKTPPIKNPGSRPRKSKVLRDKPTSQGYQCPECNKYFETHNSRYKHILKHHREGYRCSICGKVFTYKHNLKKHEQIHAGIPREQCTQCGKFIRSDLMYVHVQVHSERETFECTQCDKRFVSWATYDHHLKYSKAHTNGNKTFNFWCDTCGKGFRSKEDLKDHIHYQHLGKTEHKCPICDKLLSSRRSIKRHIKSVHEGLEEARSDKICQVCGKAFRFLRSLEEHQLIHSGERPLSCEICSQTFRQRASLYTHKKRVHKIFPPTKTLVAMDDND